MNNCVFCKIVKGEIPCYKIHENDRAFVFLDNYPAIMGHTLVIPKDHFENIHDIPEEDLEKVILAVKETAKIIQEKMKPEGINISQRNGQAAGQAVMHLHFHLLPRFKGDGFGLPPGRIEVKKTLEEVHKLLTD